MVVGGFLGLEGVDGGSEAEDKIDADGEEDGSCSAPEGVVRDVEGWGLGGCEYREGEADAAQDEEEGEQREFPGPLAGLGLGHNHSSGASVRVVG